MQGVEVIVALVWETFLWRQSRVSLKANEKQNCKCKLGTATKENYIVKVKNRIVTVTL